MISMTRKWLVVFTLLMGSSAFGAGGTMFGLYGGSGIPYLTQFGLNYVSSSHMFSVDLSYNSLSLTSGLASVSMTKPEVLLKYHPWGGSFFVGVGLGQTTFSGEATDLTTSLKVKAEVKATSITPTIGWMWGMGDGGLYYGLDVGYQTLSSPKTTFTYDTSSITTTDTAYTDVSKQVTDVGEASLPLFSFIKLGYLF